MRSLRHLFTTWYKWPGSGRWWQLKVGRQEGRDGEMEGVASPFPLPILRSHSPSSATVEGEGGRGGGGGLGHLLCLPHATQRMQLSHSKDSMTRQHYWPSDSNKKKKCFYYLTTDNDIQMCLTSQSESQSESRQLRLHVHHSRAG